MGDIYYGPEIIANVAKNKKTIPPMSVTDN